MESLLRISTIQSNLVWENPKENRAMFSEKLSGLKGKTDLVILPEMFNTGFSMNAAQIGESMDGPTVQWMRSMAKELGAVVTGSLAIQEGSDCFNRLVWMQPDGTHQHYDKRHLFTLAGEQHHYKAGKEKMMIAWMGWKICPFICYDLRFPVWCRNTEEYDLLIFMANWPEARGSHWRKLLVARAIENQAYVVGVNRVGVDGLGYVYNGDSSVIDYSGELLYRTAQVEDIFTTALALGPMRDYRNKLQFLADGDKYKILI